MEISQILDGVEATVTTDLSKKSNDKIKYLRTLKIEGQEFFIAKDFANFLGYADTDQAIRNHCENASDFSQYLKPVVLTGFDLAHIFGKNWKNTKLIQEPDIWRLMIKSKLPQAKKIEKWIFETVLPSIRKNGFYISPESLANPSKKLIKISSSIMETRKATILKREELYSRVEKFLDSETGYKPNSLNRVISTVYQHLHIATSLKTAVLIIQENLINSKNGLKINSYNPKQEKAYDKDYKIAINCYTEKQLSIFDGYFQKILEEIVMHLDSPHTKSTSKSVINILKNAGIRQIQLVTDLDFGASFQGKARSEIDDLVDEYQSEKIKYSEMVQKLSALRDGKTFKI